MKKLLFTATSKTSRYQLEVADRRLASLCKRFLKINPVSNLLLRTPYHHTVHRGDLKHKALNIIGMCDIPKALRSHLISHLRVVFTVHKAGHCHGHTYCTQALRR
jgi:hypothetical protein